MPERGSHAVERIAELLFRDAVHALDLLLLTQLLGVLRHFLAACRGLTVLAWRVRTTFHRALLGEALGPLEEQLLSFARH
jgi:hypothetical protein